jgi:hypothetical protein
MSLLMRATPAVSADLFHAIPLEILDPFLYAEHDGRNVAVTGVLERDRIERVGSSPTFPTNCRPDGNVGRKAD